LCAESLEAAQAADCGGADRIELCSNLSIGGVTPEFDLAADVIRAVAIPVYVLIRPRGGDFVYSTAEFGEMKRQIERIKLSGAAGVVTGVLLPDGRVDVERSRALVSQARPMAVTFHRAFDETPDLKEALESVILVGADSLLTSGGETDVLTGANSIASLVKLAGGRIQIIAGGGLRLETLLEVVRRTGVSALHGSLTRIESEDAGISSALETDVQAAVSLLRDEFKAVRRPEQRFSPTETCGKSSSGSTTGLQ